MQSHRRGNRSEIRADDRSAEVERVCDEAVDKLLHLDRRGRDRVLSPDNTRWFDFQAGPERLYSGYSTACCIRTPAQDFSSGATVKSFGNFFRDFPILSNRTLKIELGRRGGHGGNALLSDCGWMIERSFHRPNVVNFAIMGAFVSWRRCPALRGLLSGRSVAATESAERVDGSARSEN